MTPAQRKLLTRFVHADTHVPLTGPSIQTARQLAEAGLLTIHELQRYRYAVLTPEGDVARAGLVDTAKAEAAWVSWASERPDSRYGSQQMDTFLAGYYARAGEK
ncbi:hypothetical protein ASF30_10350 [Leifsonia sp. Leaf264]|nr:hypothetical protein ASF30_10350 [Leifsonia sp. Leaf264]